MNRLPGLSLPRASAYIVSPRTMPTFQRKFLANLVIASNTRCARIPENIAKPCAWLCKPTAINWDFLWKRRQHKWVLGKAVISSREKKRLPHVMVLTFIRPPFSFLKASELRSGKRSSLHRPCRGKMKSQFIVNLTMNYFRLAPAPPKNRYRSLIANWKITFPNVRFQFIALLIWQV